MQVGQPQKWVKREMVSNRLSYQACAERRIDGSYRKLIGPNYELLCLYREGDLWGEDVDCYRCPAKRVR